MRRCVLYPNFRKLLLTVLRIGPLSPESTRTLTPHTNHIQAHSVEASIPEPSNQAITHNPVILVSHIFTKKHLVPSPCRTVQHCVRVLSDGGLSKSTIKIYRSSLVTKRPLAKCTLVHRAINNRAHPMSSIPETEQWANMQCYNS